MAIKTQLSVVFDNRSYLKKAVSVQTYCLFSWLNCALIPKMLPAGFGLFVH